MSTKNFKPKRGLHQDTDVRYSARGYMYAKFGKTGKYQGIVSYFREFERPPLKHVPNGTLIVNIDTGFLEISQCDPSLGEPRWLSFSGSRLPIGIPSDGSYSDGLVTLSGNTTIADAIDALNEQLLFCCNSGVVPEFASHLGTTDGNTNGLLQNPSFTTGRVSSPSSPGVPFYTGGWDDDTNRDITDSSNLTWQLQGGEKITDLHTGDIQVVYSNQAGVISTETLTLDGSVNNQSSLPSGYVTVNNLSNNPGAPTIIEGFITISIPNDSLLGGGSNSGKLDVMATHTVSSGNVYSQTVSYFRDGSSSPSFTDQSVSLGTYFSKYLSGLEFISSSGGNNSELVFVIESPDIWSDSYRADPLLVNSSNYGIPNFTVSYNSSDVTKNGGPSVAPFGYNEDFVFSGTREITSDVVNPDEDGIFLSISSQLRDPFNITNGPAFSGNPPILINTFSNTSTDLLENFTDENYRLISGTTSIAGLSGSNRGVREWNSQESLITASGLQVINGALVFPQDDWSNYQPISNPDYSVIPGQVGPNGLNYFRQFASSIGRTNGVIRVEGMSELERLNKQILIDLRVVGPHIIGNPTQGPGNLGTGWLSLNEDFNFGSFSGDDGDGCFVTTGGFSAPNFEFTLGGFSTALAENLAVEVRITYPNTIDGRSQRIIRLEMINW